MKRALPILAVLAVLLAAIAIVNPFFLEPAGFLSFVRRAAPLVILAAGQYLVIVAGEFDLSVGSLVTVEVVVAARLIDGDEAATWAVLALLIVLGLFVGLVNGAVTTLLRVPSFITTLGMMLVLSGAVFLWTGGAPRGALSQAFRMFGRQTGWAVLILVVVAVAVVLLMRANFGRTLIAIGDNERAAALSGVRVTRVRIIAFALSGVSAAVAGILLGGFAGVSAQVGQGLEFQAITAVVLGGVVLGGGRGTVIAAMAGAFTLEALFTLLNLYGVSGALKFTVQGVVLIAAVAAGAIRLPFLDAPKLKGDAHAVS
ncbi:ABC transporter permease [Microbispora bryophytorum]|uniref:ABC transporter permease n=1 Tax=Microbispora bryophytorum TaxID=1460882 RepID=A0A8H9LDP6_9ACTN|nr:ABC transporter permease [Microbispora bryophytorum]MBD3141193.1 ABC transporter permease [Microbispora bryophytorum]TQR99204.1 ABC transporter permease [Microbispora bryophytorum]GGO31827.1 ABC transporter permease [Microbispora bryophytorum]